MKVLIYIDQASRDTYGMKKIGSYLLEGQTVKEVYYCNPINAKANFDWIKPNAVLMGNVDIFHGELARYFHKQGSLVFSLPTEQVISDKKMMISRIMNGHYDESESFPPPAIDLCKRIFMWGKYYKQILVENDEKMESKLTVTGSPRFTSIHKGVRELRKKGHLTIGFAFDSNYCFQNYLKQNFHYLDYWRDGGKNSGYEGQFSFISFLQGKMLRIIRDFAALENVSVILRPRFPYKHRELDFLLETSPNISLDIEHSHKNFLDKVDILYTGYSTMCLDGLLAGVPTYSLSNDFPELVHLMVPYIEKAPPYIYCHRMDELTAKDVYSVRLNGELELSPNQDDFYQYVTNNLIENFEESPANLIAQTISQDLVENKTNQVENSPSKLSSLLCFFFTNFKLVVNFKLKRITKARYFFNISDSIQGNRS